MKALKWCYFLMIFGTLLVVMMSASLVEKSSLMAMEDKEARSAALCVGPAMERFWDKEAINVDRQETIALFNSKDAFNQPVEKGLSRLGKTKVWLTFESLMSLALLRAKVFLMLLFLTLPLGVAALFQGAIERRIRFATFLAPKPALFQGSVAGLGLLTSIVVIGFFIPVAISPWVWMGLVGLGWVNLFMMVKYFHRFF